MLDIFAFFRSSFFRCCAGWDASNGNGSQSKSYWRPKCTFHIQPFVKRSTCGVGFDRMGTESEQVCKRHWSNFALFFHRLLHIERPMKLDRFIDRTIGRTIDRSIDQSIGGFFFCCSTIFMASPQIIHNRLRIWWKMILQQHNQKWRQNNRSTDLSSSKSIVRAINITLQWVWCLIFPASDIYVSVIVCSVFAHTRTNTHMRRTNAFCKMIC